MAEPLIDERELWIGEMRGLPWRGRRLLVVRLEDTTRVYLDRCPHQGQPLSAGELERGVITCPVHHHTFDAATGHGINPPGACLQALECWVEGGQVLLESAEPVQTRRLAP
jgi:nitrite reductase/ring-hydroxylating ferredoxin subunit